LAKKDDIETDTDAPFEKRSFGDTVWIFNSSKFSYYLY